MHKKMHTARDILLIRRQAEAYGIQSLFFAINFGRGDLEWSSTIRKMQSLSLWQKIKGQRQTYAQQ